MDPEEHAIIEDAFIAGFRAAPDKRAFLALAAIPLVLERPGMAALRLLEVRLDDRYRVGSAAPGFGTRELSYQPLPGTMVTTSTKLTFIYVSADKVEELTLEEIKHAAEVEHDDGRHHAHA
jgi:hypothetical protein